MPQKPDTASPIVVAAIQMSSGPDVGHNLDRAADLLRAARARGAAVAGLPENFSYMGPEGDKPGLAEDLEGPTVARLRALARETGLVILGGTFPERTADPARVHNTSVLVDAEGELRAVYRKIHLFDVDLADGSVYRESGHIAPGTEVVTGEAAGVTHGLTVCYDLRFPELYQRLERAGARLLWVPAAFTLHTGKDHWEVLLRARAIENGCYVAAPAQFGRHSEKRVTYGNALVADPWGKVLARAPDRAEGLALAEVDPAWLEAVRGEIPSHRHHVLG